MVRFVNHEHIEADRLERGHRRRLLGEVDGGDDDRCLLPGIAGGGRPVLPALQIVRGDKHRVELEARAQHLEPRRRECHRCQHERTAHPLPRLQFGHDERGFHRLAQSDIVGKQHPGGTAQHRCDRCQLPGMHLDVSVGGAPEVVLAAFGAEGRTDAPDRTAQRRMPEARQGGGWQGIVRPDEGAGVRGARDVGVGGAQRDPAAPLAPLGALDAPETAACADVLADIERTSRKMHRLLPGTVAVPATIAGLDGPSPGDRQAQCRPGQALVNSTVTDVLMPPRALKSPMMVMRRGWQTPTRSSRIWLVAAS